MVRTTLSSISISGAGGVPPPPNSRVIGAGGSERSILAVQLQETEHSPRPNDGNEPQPAIWGLTTAAFRPSGVSACSAGARPSRSRGQMVFKPREMAVARGKNSLGFEPQRVRFRFLAPEACRRPPTRVSSARAGANGASWPVNCKKPSILLR